MTAKIIRDAWRARACWSFIQPRVSHPVHIRSLPSRSHYNIMGILRHEVNRSGLANDAAKQEALSDAPDFLRSMTEEEDNSDDQGEGFAVSPTEVLDLLSSVIGGWSDQEKSQFAAQAKS